MVSGDTKVRQYAGDMHTGNVFFCGMTEMDSLREAKLGETARLLDHPTTQRPERALLGKIQDRNPRERSRYVMTKNGTLEAGPGHPSTSLETRCDCCRHDDCAGFRKRHWCKRVYELHGRPGYSMTPLEFEDKFSACLGHEVSEYEYLFVEDATDSGFAYRILLRLGQGEAPLDKADVSLVEQFFVQESEDIAWLLSREDDEPYFYVCSWPCCVAKAIDCIASWMDVAETQWHQGRLTLWMELVREWENAHSCVRDGVYGKKSSSSRGADTDMDGSWTV